MAGRSDRLRGRRGGGPGRLAGTTTPRRPAARQTRAAAAIAYARAQLGKPYLWGGTGPDAYDCSGLAMEAYAAAGDKHPRTSQEQWAAGPQVSTPQPGDLVFFPGADGTWARPGHVGIVVDPAKHLMIDAYASGSRSGTPHTARPGPPAGLSESIGFTDPAAHAGTS